MSITHDEYQNLISSEEEIYGNAISSLPEEDRRQYYDTKKKSLSIKQEFMKRLKESDPDLIRSFLKLEAASTEKSEYLADAMYLKGVTDEHSDLRMMGWKAP